MSDPHAKPRGDGIFPIPFMSIERGDVQPQDPEEYGGNELPPALFPLTDANMARLADLMGDFLEDKGHWFAALEWAINELNEEKREERNAGKR
jgi:hypothetical protein